MAAIIFDLLQHCSVSSSSYKCHYAGIYFHPPYLGASFCPAVAATAAKLISAKYPSVPVNYDVQISYLTIATCIIFHCYFSCCLSQWVLYCPCHGHSEAGCLCIPLPLATWLTFSISWLTTKQTFGNTVTCVWKVQHNTSL